MHYDKIIISRRLITYDYIHILEAHRRRVRKEKLSHHRGSKCETDSDVLQRLQDLQLQEMRGHEMSRSVLTSDIACLVD